MSTYLRFPALHKNSVAFVTEDDLWTVSRQGGQARRLTNMAGRVSFPCYSPDGKWIAFSSTHEGIDQVYLMPAEGGELRRLTFEGQPCHVVGFHPSGERVLFRSSRDAAVRSQVFIYSVDLKGTQVDRLPVGQAQHVSFHRDGERVVLGRHQVDAARWKRYRGGQAGDIWIGNIKTNEFRRLLSLEGNVTLPLWVENRIFFISDHEGVGRIYSCDHLGNTLRRHTNNKEFYARWLKTDGETLIYQMGAEIYLLPADQNRSQKVEIQTTGVRSDTYQKFVEPMEYIEDFALHPKGHLAAYTIRGKFFVMPHWGGAPIQLGQRDGVRYRLPRWIHEGEQLALLSDETGHDAIEIWSLKERQKKGSFALNNIPCVVKMCENRARNLLAFSDAAMNLYLFDLDNGTYRAISKSNHGKITEMAWSPDGRWLAFVKPLFWLYSGGIVCLYDTVENREVELTSEEVTGHSPIFDPEGRYLYILSERTFNPILDKIQFLASCPQATKPYLFVLDKNSRAPFAPKIEEEPENPSEKEEGEKGGKAKEVVCKIDLEGLTDRLVEFPNFPVGNYTQLSVTKEHVMMLSHPIIGLLDHSFGEPYPDELKPNLVLYDLKKEKSSTFAHHVDDYEAAGEKIAYFQKDKLRVVKVGDKPSEEEDETGFNPHSGWVDVNRIRVSIQPILEWRQMFLEAWRLQRDHFWTHDMAGVPWEKMKERYLPLVEKVSTRAELSDLVWELQGELGTSHAYEWGGEYPRTPRYDVGLLGADLELQNDQYLFRKIYTGDVWAAEKHSPLSESGVNIRRGDILLAINGHAVGPQCPPASLLVHQAGNDVTLTILSPGEKEEPRDITIKSLKSDRPARYREWVNENRRYVFEKSGGKLGFIHIPDMMGEGLSEFFRSFSVEAKRPGLIVDGRDNGGGFVSQLIIEQLRREVIGYDKPRYGSYETYPLAAVRGPIVALCNEYTGSDGDVFSHAFKAYKLGKLIGKRTWGGVIGIDVSNFLVDGGLVTQPEFASWFYNSGWDIENRGVDPDIEVEFDPASQAGGKDPQLDKAIEIALEELNRRPVEEPAFDAPPKRAAQIVD